jgi:electron transfer flavoprotein alpha subunit
VSSFVSQDMSKSERPELTSARSSSPAAAAWVRRELQIIEALADKLGAGVGASRAAVDAGYACRTTGRSARPARSWLPDLYIAVGISGAIQHLAGMKDSKVIVAINKDEEAPIFQVADYGLVATCSRRAGTDQRLGK